jgi:hypothetical protein
MTSKVYRTAQGKSVDLGTIMLQNEHVRAVGNMNVNARGDQLDNNNRVVETKPRLIQKQNARATNVSSDPVHTSARSARRAREKAQEFDNQESDESPAVQDQQPDSPPVAVSEPPAQDIPDSPPVVGLAAAIARQREVKQELEKTRRQQQQAHGLRKI